MNVISTTHARMQLPALMEHLARQDGAFVIGRRNKPEAILIKYPTHYRSDLSDSTLINAGSASFNFLAEEPELYSSKDVR